MFVTEDKSLCLDDIEDVNQSTSTALSLCVIPTKQTGNTPIVIMEFTVMMMMISLPKDRSSWLLCHQAMNEVVSLCLPHRQLRVNNCPRSLRSGYDQIQTLYLQIT